MSSNRFSIVILEKDVLEYHNYKLKYNKYYDLFMNANYENKESLRIKRDYWYNKYINKMQFGFRKKSGFDYSWMILGEQNLIVPGKICSGKSGWNRQTFTVRRNHSDVSFLLCGNELVNNWSM